MKKEMTSILLFNYIDFSFEVHQQVLGKVVQEIPVKSERDLRKVRVFGFKNFFISKYIFFEFNLKKI